MAARRSSAKATTQRGGGEQELVVVIETQTEVQCGAGYCSLRATAVLDVPLPSSPSWR